MTFKDMSPNDFSNCEIHNSCFYQKAKIGDKIPKDIFPDGVENLIFVRCNLDNVLLPKGATMIDSTNKLIQQQIDGLNWIVDKTLKPIELLDKPIPVEPKETTSIKCPDCGVTHSFEKETGLISAEVKPALIEKEL